MIRGFKFPFQRGDNGFPAPAEEEDVVLDNIFSIMNSAVGARVMRPRWGLGAQRLVFEATGPLLEAVMDFEIRRAISIGEPRVSITHITVVENENSDDDEVGRVVVDVGFLFLGRQNNVQIEVER